MKGGFKRKNTEHRTNLELNTKADSLASLEQEPGRPSDPWSIELGVVEGEWVFDNTRR